MKILVVVDIQNDFVDGSLGTKEAQAIVDSACSKIQAFEGKIFVTMDTQYQDYLSSNEGKKLPVVHCVKDSEGWKLNSRIQECLDGKDVTIVEKPTFGAVDLPRLIESYANDDDFSIEVIGLCTDICVVSNALLLKANFYQKEVIVDASCCAGVSPATHKAALDTMRMCQINVINE